MADSDKTIQILETRFPSISGDAFAAARQEVLDSGQSILTSDRGIIYRVYPNGRRVKVKEVEPPTEVVPGSKFTIR